MGRIKNRGIDALPTLGRSTTTGTGVPTDHTWALPQRPQGAASLLWCSLTSPIYNPRSCTRRSQSPFSLRRSVVLGICSGMARSLNVFGSRSSNDLMLDSLRSESSGCIDPGGTQSRLEGTSSSVGQNDLCPAEENSGDPELQG